LLKDFSTISLKKFDLDFAVDPLFKKTSADFDEGGARGLLLNHLNLDQYCKIIFDASDATVECEVEDMNDEQPVLHIDHIEQPVEEEAEATKEDEDADEAEAIVDTEGEGEKVTVATEMDIDDHNEEKEVPKSPVAETKADDTSEGSKVEIFRLKGKKHNNDMILGGSPYYIL
jgi:condensin complex subunit 2